MRICPVNNTNKQISAKGFVDRNVANMMKDIKEFLEAAKEEGLIDG